MDSHWFKWFLIFFLGFHPPFFSPDALMAQTIPPLQVTIYDSAATGGYYFMIPYRAMPPHPYDHPQLILDGYGRVVYYWIPPETTGLGSSTLDFKLHTNGMMSYWSPLSQKFFLMDSTFMVVDSIAVVNGYEADAHELMIGQNGHYFLLGRESRYMNLTAYHWFGYNHSQPGNPNAEVIGAVIQEFDEAKNLVWEWKAHDHYAFADVDSIWLSNAARVDWTHANAIAQDDDGHLLLSVRHFNEITKIHHQTGNILWRFGGKSNQFTILNDPVGFTGQHDIRCHPNDHISFLDNGQYNALQVARGVEYSLNESAKIATLVWEYIHDSAMFSTSLGSHQVCPDGRHLMDFGTVQTEYPWMVFTHADKSPILELDCPQGYVSYRAYHHDTLPWILHRPEVLCIHQGDAFYLEAEPGHPEYRWSTGAKTQTIPIIDTGIYWVYVPYGQGYISSEPIRITDPVNPCQVVSPDVAFPLPDVTLDLYPNPSHGRVHLRFFIPPGTHGILSGYHFSGLPVEGFQSVSFPSGTHEKVVEAGSLPPGVYLISLTTLDGRLTKPLVIY